MLSEARSAAPPGRLPTLPDLAPDRRSHLSRCAGPLLDLPPGNRVLVESRGLRPCITFGPTSDPLHRAAELSRRCRNPRRRYADLDWWPGCSRRASQIGGFRVSYWVGRRVLGRRGAARCSRPEYSAAANSIGTKTALQGWDGTRCSPT